MGVRPRPPCFPDRMGSTLANMGSEQLETHPEISQISWEPHGIDMITKCERIYVSFLGVTVGC